MNILPEKIRNIENLTQREQISILYDYINYMYESIEHFSSTKHLNDLDDRLTRVEMKLKEDNA